MPDPTAITWHSTLTGDIAGEVPDLMEATNNLVDDFLDKNRAYADSALATANAAIVALSNATLPEELPSPPDVPSIITSAFLGSGLGTGQAPSLGTLTPQNFPTFTPDAITIPDITSEIPDYVPVVTGLTIPEPPVFALPATPEVPGIDFTFDIPDAPVADYGLPPTLYELNLPVFTAPVLPVFNDAAPEFNVLPPSPFIQWQEPVYQSDVQDAIKVVLKSMLAGGTGLPADVERAIWERGRDREESATAKVVSEASDQWATRGFNYPPGMLNAQIMAAREEGNRKSNEFSREVAIKQADLEQTNRNFAVEKGIAYESVFTGLYMQIVDRNFQIAKFTVESTIQIYNAEIAAFNVNQAVFAQKTERVKVQLEIAFSILKNFQAQVDAEKAKGEFNTQLQAQYDSKIKAFHEAVEVYKVVVGAAVSKKEIEKLKVELFKGQIEGQVAEIGVQRGAFEAYAARVSGESAKAGLEESNARVYGSKVQAFATRAEIEIKESDLKVQVNRQKLDYSIALIGRIAAENSQQLNVIQANLAAYQASTTRAVAEFNASTTLTQLQNTTHIELSRLSIEKYRALLEQWKTRAQEIISMATINAESLRAAGQIASNLASGAMAGTHVSAGVSAAASASQQRSDQKSEHLAFQQNTSDSNSFAVTINRKGADVA